MLEWKNINITVCCNISNFAHQYKQLNKYKIYMWSKQCSTNSLSGQWKVGNPRDLILFDPNSRALQLWQSAKSLWQMQTFLSLQFTLSHTPVNSPNKIPVNLCIFNCVNMLSDSLPLLMLTTLTLAKMILQMMRRLRMVMMLVIRLATFELCNGDGVR